MSRERPTAQLSDCMSINVAQLHINFPPKLDFGAGAVGSKGNARVARRTEGLRQFRRRGVLRVEDVVETYLHVLGTAKAPSVDVHTAPRQRQRLSLRRREGRRVGYSG